MQDIHMKYVYHILNPILIFSPNSATPCSQETYQILFLKPSAGTFEATAYKSLLKTRLLGLKATLSYPWLRPC
jgi:hypothetical protein